MFGKSHGGHSLEVIMRCRYGCALPIARAMFSFGDWSNIDWNELQEVWQRFAPDRRYKLWFCAASRSSAIMRVGSQEYYLVRKGDSVYSREYYHDYEEKPCFKVQYRPDLGKYTFDYEWQYDYKI